MEDRILASSPSHKASSAGTANFRTEEIRGYLFKKTREGKWQKRWFETNGCFLTYYKKQGQKLLAALNLPQVGAITLLQEDHVDGPGLFTIELNERVYTIKARSHDEAAFWVDALLWRQAGGLVTQKPLDVAKKNLDNLSVSRIDAASTNSPIRTVDVNMAAKHRVDVETANTNGIGKDGAPCAACCAVQ
ncbi:hypothetical protein CCR75_001249 [Bremia lactucae]|uniref:PH domain-containing protein n=1 Tax=Bremia lactucae TaxID=4779 RepID=A0A976NYF9_BRELC|nr:hypothetical protein CCR75_001249 [Bremia lactucae]